MALYCNLCGVRTDGTRRLGVYCPGARCGTDLRAVDNGGVQAWCEPERQNGRPGRTATVRLTVRNATGAADSYRVDPLEPIEGHLEFDAAEFAAPLAPGGVRTVELRYTPPRDRVGLGLDIASRFGVPGADLAGEVGDAAGARFGVALRVASRTNPHAACAAFAVDVPGRVRMDRPQPDAQGGRSASTPGMPLLIGAVVLVLIAVAAVIALNGGNSSDKNTGSEGPRPGVTAPDIVGGSGPTTPPTTPATTPGRGNGEGNGNGGKSVPPEPEITTPPVSPRRQVTMRDLYGLSVDDAKRELAEDGLKAKVVVDEHTGTPKGNVRATEPEEGALVDVGSSVVLHVSDGKFQLDNYVGQNVDTAAAALRGLGLQPVTATATEDVAVPHRQVVSTSPAAGSWVSEGEVVTLSIHYEPLA